MIIKDKLIEPYEIHWDDTFTIKEPNGFTIDKKSGQQIQLYKVYGYYSTLEGALKSCCKLLVEKSFEVATIKEIVEKFELLWLDIKNTIKI